MPAAVEPLPPVAPGRLPWVGSGVALLRNPTEFLTSMRARLGDTFVVDAFGYRLFCVFSPAGVRRLYALPEDEASFGLATYRLIGFKLPPVLLEGRTNLAKQLFGRHDTERYLGHLEEAVRLEIDALGDGGELEAFTEAKRLGHRLGFAAWAGQEAASPRYLDRLVPLFERLDTEEAFVRPAAMFRARLTRQRAERRAMRGVERIVAEIRTERERRGVAEGDFLEELYGMYEEEPRDVQDANVARDVILLHLGAQSNLYAALAWTLVNLLLRPEHLDRVIAGDDGLLERCASESIRMAQRSITLREVVRPVEVRDEERAYALEPGVFVTTMLSVNNTSAAPGLERFDPAHYDGRRLAVDLPAKELVSTFGHGTHSCPAQRFAISAIRVSVRRLLDAYVLEPRFESAVPRPRQIGAVARAARPCPVAYRRRR